MILRSIIDYILPYRCISCSEMTTSQVGLCASCFKKLNFITPPFCNKCGFPFEFDIEGQIICGKCMINKNYYDTARSLFKFDAYSRRLVHDFKYNDRTSHAKLFAKALVSKYKEELKHIDIVVPVPMNRIKRIFRRYNQSQILALELAKLLEFKMISNALVKTKWTKPQIKLSKIEREKNLNGSLLVNKNINIKGKNILLVDDVKTTGTTANACAKLLKKVGANYVMLMTIGAT